MATYDFTDAEQTTVETKNAHKKTLTQQSGALISQLVVFKATFDELIVLVDEAERPDLTTKFDAFKLDVKNTLGL